MKYKKELKEVFKDVDFMEAVHEPKRESTLLLEEQGITTLSALLGFFLYKSGTYNNVPLKLHRSDP